MNNIVSEQGQVAGQMMSNSAVFGSKMVDFVDAY